MSNPNKQLGTGHESDVTSYLKRWYPFAKRKAQAGAKDEGDIGLGDGIPVAVEAKTYKVKTSDPIHLAQWMKELEAEIVNSGAETGVVIAKRRGTTDVGEYFAVMPVRYWLELMLRLYPPPQRRRLVRRRSS